MFERPYDNQNNENPSENQDAHHNTEAIESPKNTEDISDAFGAMDGEKLEQKAISSLADDVGASRVDYESVLERLHLNSDQLALLKRGANGLEYFAMKQNEPENFKQLEDLHEKGRSVIREMLEEYQGEGIA
jgi:hypothetical protein